MEKRQTNYISSFILAIALAGIVACEGPEGPTGPQGTQGEQGPVGPQGPQGEEGTDNVIYSEWMDVEWNGYNAEASTYKRMDIIEPRITEEFMGMGIVLMYLNLGGNVVYAIPFATSGVEYTFFMRPAEYSALLPGTFPEEPGLSFSQKSEGLVAYIGDPPRIRYVLIPDGMPAKIHAGFWEDYEAVAEYFGIPE